MTYELCKKLKDAGFPQKSGLYLHSKGEQKILAQVIFGDDWVYVPTLSELIEACGDAFRELRYHPYAKKDESLRIVSYPIWSASGWGINPHYKELKYPDSENDKHILEIEGGDTAEIAVANLWLKLKEMVA